MTRRPRARLPTHRGLTGAGLILAAGLLAGAPGLTFATPCDVIPGISPANTSFGVLATSDDSNDRRWTVSLPYWIAVGVIANDPGDDFDINVFNNTQNANLPCYTGPLGTSSRGAGQTDFVVGDFNHNPYAEYVNTITCYSGNCDSQLRGHQVWRDGDLFSVNGAAQVLTLPASADRVVKIWDIYLAQGTTYHFRFQPTVGDNQPKLLLFRNAGGGVFWTGRYGAEFETANCITNYTALSTGYYGMVVVSDRYSVNPVAITLEVTTGAACACPPIIAVQTPQTIAPGATEYVAGLENLYGYDWVVGVRSTSDWDIYGGESAIGPDAGCMTSAAISSTMIPPKTDFILAERPYTTFPHADTFAVRALRFSGSDGAVLNSAPLLGTDSNLTGQTGYLNSSDIGKGWITYLWQDTTYSIRFFPGGDVKLLVFDHLAEASPGWHSRSNAVLETSSSTSFTAPRYGVYGFVLVNDDGGIDNYDFAFGFCNSARPLVNKQPLNAFDPIYPGEHKPYFSFNQSAPQWAAACVYGSGGLDWDIGQYGQPTGSPWPECLGAAGALSNGVVGADVIAGDFHHVPTGPYYLHSYRAGVNDQGAGYTEWDSGSGALQINPTQPTHVNVSGSDYSDRLWCYEAYLYAGFPYTLSFLAAGAASLRALVFENPGTAAYWAPRSAAILSSGGTTIFTPASTGWHGIVVVNDNEQAGSFDLSLQSSVLAADAPAAPTRTELTAVAPNPSRGEQRIDYTLARPARVSFDVLDLAGRIVTRIPASASGSGRWTQIWDGRGGDGRALAGGVYWLRMQADGHSVATRKILRLN